MNIPKIYETEYRFCLIVWEHEPIRSGELAKLAAEKLGWSKTTTFTIIKRLSDRGVLQNKDRFVTSLIPKEAVQTAELRELMAEKFEGDLPSFLAAFAANQHLSEEDVEEIRRIIAKEETP